MPRIPNTSQNNGACERLTKPLDRSLRDSDNRFSMNAFIARRTMDLKTHPGSCHLRRADLYTRRCKRTDTRCGCEPRDQVGSGHAGKWRLREAAGEVEKMLAKTGKFDGRGLPIEKNRSRERSRIVAAGRRPVAVKSLNRRLAVREQTLLIDVMSRQSAVVRRRLSARRAETPHSDPIQSGLVRRIRLAGHRGTSHEPSRASLRALCSWRRFDPLPDAFSVESKCAISEKREREFTSKTLFQSSRPEARPLHEAIHSGR